MENQIKDKESMLSKMIEDIDFPDWSFALFPSRDMHGIRFELDRIKRYAKQNGLYELYEERIDQITEKIYQRHIDSVGVLAPGLAEMVDKGEFMAKSALSLELFSAKNAANFLGCELPEKLRDLCKKYNC